MCAMEVVVNGEMIRGNEAAMKAGFKEKLAFEVHLKCIKIKMCSSVTSHTLGWTTKCGQ